MRLIDGDELYDLYANTEDTNLDNFSVPIPVIRQNIKDMPTIKYAPIIEAYWIAQDETYTKFMCSNCKSLNHDGSGKYCSECGAKIRRKEYGSN